MGVKVYGYSSSMVLPLRRIVPVRPAPTRAVDNAAAARVARFEFNLGLYSRSGRRLSGSCKVNRRVVDVYV